MLAAPSQAKPTYADRGEDPNQPVDLTTLEDKSSYAERKLLNGDGYENPAPLPEAKPGEDYNRLHSEDGESDE